jgi:hypothetical protein
MRISTLALAGAFVLAAGTAAYADDVMANTYANTITTTDAKGNKAALLFNADGTYTTNATGPDGKPVSIPGKWVVNGGNICLTNAAPPGSPVPAASCSPVVMHAVGDTWSVTNDQGAAYQVVLTAGR